MAIKRKCTDDSSPANVKHIKLIPFPYSDHTTNGDNDVEMADIDIMPAESQSHHARFHSNASSDSSTSSLTHSSSFPTLDLSPLTSSNPVYSTYHSYPGYDNSPPSSSPIGLLQPTSFKHHGICTQIPKLRIACASGLNNQRSMWSYCEQCGAISMIDSPDS